MATTKVKIIDSKGNMAKDTRQYNWEVMKPFLSFSFKALKVIGLGLIAIIKAMPMLRPSPDDTNTTIKRR